MKTLYGILIGFMIASTIGCTNSPKPKKQKIMMDIDAEAVKGFKQTVASDYIETFFITGEGDTITVKVYTDDREPVKKVRKKKIGQDTLSSDNGYKLPK